jgi:hypothetical protein
MFDRQNALTSEDRVAIGAAEQPSSPPVVMGYLQAKRANEIAQRSPWLAPETVVALAKAEATDDAVDLASQYSAQREIDSYPQKLSSVGDIPFAPLRWAFNGAGYASKAVGKVMEYTVPKAASAAINYVLNPVQDVTGQIMDVAIKPATRWMTAALDIIPETTQNLLSMAAGSSNFDIGGLWESTSLATMIDNPSDQGEGFFMSQTLREEQAKRARAFRGTIYGNEFTLGRSITSVFGEKSLAYRYASGVIDAIVMMAVPDPTKIISKGVATAGRVAPGVIRALATGDEVIDVIKNGGGLRGIVPLLSEADAESVRTLFRSTGGKFKSEAGLAKTIEGASVDGAKFVDFMRSNAWAKKLVSDLVEEDDSFKIMKDTFGYKISTDTAVRLSMAKTEDEVISALTRPFTLGEGTLNANIGKYKVDRNPAKLMVRNMRFFTQMPKNTIVVTGLDDMDNVDAVRNMANSMRTAGVSTDKISEWGNKAIRAFTTGGTPTERFRVYESYQNAVREIIVANGVEAEAADAIVKRAKSGIDKLKTYLSDRTGLETDNGMLKAMMHQLAHSADSKVYAEFLERAGQFGDDAVFASPTDLIQLLNRVQVLPDVREIRRVTRNPLFQDMLTKIGAEDKISKFALAGRKETIEVTRYRDPEKAKQLQTQIAELRQSAAGLVGDNKKAVLNQIEEIDDELGSLMYKENVRTLTGRARKPIELADYIQTRIWKPLNLATVGYIVRNGIDAQIRMAMGGSASMFNMNPFEYISIAFGLPGQNMRYSRSITGVDLSRLGVAKVSARGVVQPIIAGSDTDKLRVAGREFPNTVSGRRRASAHSKRTNRPIFYPIDDGVDLDDVTAASEVHEQLLRSIGANGQRVGMTAADSIRHEVRTGSFAQTTKADGGGRWVRGMIEQMQMKQNLEPTRILARAVAAGKSPQESVDEVVDWLLKNKNSQSYRSLRQKLFDGIEFRKRDTPYTDFSMSVDIEGLAARGLDEEVRGHLRAYVTSVWYDDIKKLTGGLKDVEFLLAYDAVPNLKAARNIFLDEIPLTKNRKSWKVGDKAEIDGQRGIITSIDETGDRPFGVFVPIEEENALRNFDPGKASVKAKRLLEKAPDYDDATGRGVPVKIPFEQKLYGGADQDWRTGAGIASAATDWFFNILNDSAVRKLERSVTFRGFYYETIAEYANKLSYEEGVRLYDDIAAKAAEEGKNIRQYIGEGRFVGGTKVTDVIENLPKRKNVTGTLTIGELDDYSRFQGISKTKELLYDAADRNNLMDALRIVMPFADAWKEVLGTYMSLGAQHNIHLIRKFGRVYTGLEEADPDQDGRGMFFKDPQTGEVQFQFPMSGSLSQLLTGIDAPLSAPLGRLSQGINFMPALGPYAQFGLSQFVPDTPDYDSLKELFLPYGETTAGELVSSVFPGVVRKFVEAARADTENLNSQFAQTYLETMRALSVNPKYNLATEQGRTELFADAKFRARIMTGMRMMSQFLGPSAGVQEWKVPTKVGDQYVGVLLEELRRFQTENYDTSIDRFLDLYGDDLALYVSSKSQALADGLEATEEFGVWERNNRAVVEQYKNVGAYFAPMGSDYNFSVWERQLTQGKRKRLNDRELVDLAQLRIGSVKYRKLRQMFGANPSDKQSEVLRSYREYLNELMPGFPVKPVFTTNKFENSLLELEDAVKDSRLADNKITPLVKRYLDARRQALGQLGAPSLRSKKAMPYKDYLFRLGESLANQEPEFDRIWSRFLSQEVEL